VDKTMTPSRSLRDANVDADDVDGVVMVGGATRMPHVQRAVSEFFGHAARTSTRQGGGAGRGHPGQLLAGNRAPATTGCCWT
jgi:molecular chaperone HscA